MRKFLLAAVAAAAIASPAMARDGSPYVGIEGGILLTEDLDQDVRITEGGVTTTIDDAYTVGFKTGFDGDLIAGYDFGLFRLEGELGYKRIRPNEITLSNALGDNLGVNSDDFDVSDSGSIISLMANGLLDFGDDDGWSGFVGAGVGTARVKFAGDRDSALAWQAVGGVRRAITPNVDLGVKYRFFRTGRVRFNDTFNDGVTTLGLSSSGRVTTHSLLASLIYNFAAPAPVIVEPVIAPPPPPAPAPATQTCYDGSVILATDVCPQPPAPVPTPERG